MEIFDRLNLPLNHQSAKLSEINDKASHKQIIVDYVENIKENLEQGKGLYVSHTQSTGKSGIASICLKAAASKGKVGLWLTGEKIPGYFIENYQFDDGQSVQERASTVPLLVIDEFAFPFSTSSSRGKKVYTPKIGGREQMIESLIRRRIDAKKSTIITSNIGPNGLKQMYPELYRVLTEAVTFVTTDPNYKFRPHD